MRRAPDEVRDSEPQLTVNLQQGCRFARQPCFRNLVIDNRYRGETFEKDYEPHAGAPQAGAQGDKDRPPRDARAHRQTL